MNRPAGSATTATTAVTTDPVAGRLSMRFPGVLRAEWIKLRSLRSTWLTLACLYLVGLGIATLSMASAGQEYRDSSAEERLSWDPTELSLTTYLAAQLIFGVLAILVITSEYATGQLQSSLGAVPRRRRLLAAKVTVTAVISLVAGQVLVFASFVIGQAFLAGQQVPSASLGDPGVLSAVVGGGLYLAAIALLAIGIATIVRATAGAIAILVGIVLLVPAFSGLFPSWLLGVSDFWPSQGAAAVMATVPDADYPHPWWNLAGMCLGVAAVLAAAFVTFERRDV